MAEFKISKKKKASCLSIKGDLTIAYAGELKDALTKVSKNAGEITIQIEDAGTIDAACLQLFCSAHISVGADRKFVFTNLQSPGFEQAVRDAGFNHMIGCGQKMSDNCFWKGGSE